MGNNQSISCSILTRLRKTNNFWHFLESLGSWAILEIKKLDDDNNYFSLILRIWGWHCETRLSPPVKIFLLTDPRRCFFCGPFVLFMSWVCHAFVSVHCWLVLTCWERADLLALVCDVQLCFWSLSHVVSWVRCGSWLYRLLTFATFLTKVFSESWSKAEHFHVRLWRIEHGDISYLFHKLTIHA